MKTWPNTVLLEAGLAIECVKHKAPQYFTQAVTWLEDTAEELDKKYGKPYPCSGNWMCMREQVRHKAGCPGKTKHIDEYVRQLKSC